MQTTKETPTYATYDEVLTLLDFLPSLRNSDLTELKEVITTLLKLRSHYSHSQLSYVHL